MRTVLSEKMEQQSFEIDVCLECYLVQSSAFGRPLGVSCDSIAPVSPSDGGFYFGSLVMCRKFSGWHLCTVGRSFESSTRHIFDTYLLRIRCEISCMNASPKENTRARNVCVLAHKM